MADLTSGLDHAVDSILRPAELKRRLQEVLDNPNNTPTENLGSVRFLLDECRRTATYVGQHPEFMGALEIKALHDVCDDVQASVNQRESAQARAEDRREERSLV